MFDQKIVRIIAGKLKGRKLKVPKGFASSPMGNRQRQAIFNSLVHKLPAARVIDAFAGSGSLGLEALSRGASFAQFVEKDGFTFAELKKNILSLELDASTYALRRSSSYNFMKNNQHLKFDIIFVDPPYNNFKLKYIEELAQLLGKGGIMVVSSPVEEELPENIGNLSLSSERVMARARISFYE
jgi:16S rRNA (guanine966-N2)-methyltransferase